MAWQTTARKTAAWVIGIIVWFACTLALMELGRKTGVKVEEYYDPPITVRTSYGTDEEIDHDYTMFGTAAIFLGLMIAIRVGLSIHRWSWKVHETERERLVSRAWFMALLVIGIYTILLERAFHGVRSGFWMSALHTVLKFGGIIGIGRGIWLWYKHRTRDLPDQPPNPSV